jgi:protocatechuate 3,4-dioxygenase beta subunit
MQVTTAAGLKGTTTPIPAAGNAVALTADPAAVTSLEMTVEGTAGKWIEITTTAGANTNVANIAGAGFYKVLADGEVIVPIAITSPANAQSYTIAVNAAAATNYVVSFATAAPAWTVGPNANYTLKTGSSSTVVGVLKDQYNRPYASKAVTITVAGRNPQAVSATTSATGSVSVTVADTYAAAVLTTDTVTFNYTESTTVSATATRTITYTATGIVAGSVVVTDSDADNAVTIDQTEATVGSPTSIVTYTATARTAAGAAVGAGALVTFTAGANDVFVDDIASAVTDANGQATVQVFRRAAGYAAVTASIGGATGSNSAVLFSNTATDTRNVAMTLDKTSAEIGKWVTLTLTATDRWGNPVAGAAVTWTEVGPGRFVYPAQPSNIAISLTTNSKGQASIDLKTEDSEGAGANTVEASVAATSQTASIAGRVGATAVTAIAGATDNSTKAGNRLDTKSVTWSEAPVEVIQDAPTLSVAKSTDGARIFLTGTCMADEGDIIVYVKTPGGAWKELAKTAECFAGEFDANRKMPKNSKLYRVKQEGTGLFSNQVLVRK